VTVTTRISSPQPPRLLQDLAEGRLEEAEIAALVDWLTAEGLVETPAELLTRGLQPAHQIGVGAA
jgi:hypothetical protein